MTRHAALAVLLFCTLVPRLATLRRAPSGELQPHAEADEQVYATLIAQVRADPLGYTLQGTPLLRRLDAHNYDKPIFFHAPAFVYLGAMLTALGLPLPLFPVLLELGAIVCVHALTLRLFGRREALWAAGLLATCTITWFAAQHIWIDAMLVFSVSLALLLADRAGREATPAAYALAGGALRSPFSPRRRGCWSRRRWWRSRGTMIASFLRRASWRRSSRPPCRRVSRGWRCCAS